MKEHREHCDTVFDFVLFINKIRGASFDAISPWFQLNSVETAETYQNRVINKMKQQEELGSSFIKWIKWIRFRRLVYALILLSVISKETVEYSFEKGTPH